MTTTLTPPRSTGTAGAARIGTARLTGLLYLGIAVTGMLGFLAVRPLLFDPDDPAATLANLLDHEALARAGIALELALVVTQALAALWFYKLFRPVDAFAAGAIAVFGTVNAVVVLGSAAFLATSLETALATGSGSDAHLMFLVSENLWGVGNIFFGLWLVPMGWCALRSAGVPWTLGRVLMVGGAGYVLSAFVTYLLPDAGALTSALVLPATIGEVWMVGLLLVRGERVPLGQPRR